ncbi:MAG TPA: iron-containing alcohol dehydrogenase family protein [Ideonella sp.]|uniref:iron-containing alcohol dehydrogenase family protein n=1 Tax=Ideonella sp. TaxID=1929293 RepID=UPI002BC65917|nr:iron-containing alcohol dehydrogenase family protein [Ideonella sp.]HSI47076.1 iron-containing alcohol dehydrogenase family protein [Ideonella sp.]
MTLSYQHVSAELRLFHGSESLLALRRELERAGSRRAVIICGRTIARSTELQMLRETLGSLVAGVCPSAREHSPVAGIEEAASLFEQLGADAIVAVGGGSAAVTARAAAILNGERRPLAELCTRRMADGRFESPRLNAQKLPLFVVPTTPSTAFVKAGTAVHDAQGKRLALFDPKTRARAVFVHPGFLQTAPDALVQSAALNALANAVEALESPQCDPVSEALLMQALRLVQRGLTAFDGLHASEARETLVVAALLCGRGTEQGGTGLASVLAHAIGQRSHVANGVVNAIVLPHTMRFNAPVTAQRSPSIRQALAELDAEPSADTSAIGRVQVLLARVDLPRRLRDIGVLHDDLAPLAEAAMADWFVSRNARPVKDVQTLLEVLEAAW